MTRRLVAGYLAITVFVLVVLAVPLGVMFADRERERLTTAIERDARVLAATADDALESGQVGGLGPLAAHYQEQTGGRAVIVDSTGIALADSENPTDPTADFSTRPEITEALAGRFTSGQRASATLGHTLYYVAVPISHGDQVLGAVRVTYASDAVDDRVRRVWVQLGGLGAVVIVITGLGGWLMAMTISGPIRHVEAAADSLASGDLTARTTSDEGPAEVRRLSRSFNQMADQLSALIGAQRSFLADASHQLRTPLTALRLRLESLGGSVEGGSVGASGADLEAADAEVDRLSNLVDGLLAMARIDAQTSEPTVIDVDPIVAERVDVWAPLADERDVDLVTDVITDQGADHRADRPRGRASAVGGSLEQILDNLIANAIEVAPAGSTVTVSTATTPTSVTVAVTDAGPGLSAEQSVKAFDRFWRSPGAPPGGSGLGLAIVRQLAEASGGTATIEHPIPGGLRVVVNLPLAHKGT